MAFQFLITLDFSSHYMHMYSSLLTGSRSHKQITSDVSKFLKFYYDPRTLFVMCAGNELFFVGLYLLKWVDTPLSVSLGMPLPFWGAYTWAEAMTLVCFPICATKNVVNVVQLWKASKILVGVDLAERAKAREEDVQKPKKT
ncbi:hypothetical protein EVJ58_g7119 [Rhodofomes roseus]|nr:hypothetical protein EVJ58_g7119 [Rhodofomes roseus]